MNVKQQGELLYKHPAPKPQWAECGIGSIASANVGHLGGHLLHIHEKRLQPKRDKLAEVLATSFFPERN